jgi:hypothetical protein
LCPSGVGLQAQEGYEEVRVIGSKDRDGPNSPEMEEVRQGFLAVQGKKDSVTLLTASYDGPLSSTLHCPSNGPRRAHQN